MRHDIIGATLLGISAFLYAARYIAAAIFAQGGVGPRDGTSEYLFQRSYNHVGDGLTICAGIALLVGLVVLNRGIYASGKRKEKTKE